MLSDPPQLLSVLNWLDWLVLALVLLVTLEGIRRGLLGGALGLVGTVLTIAVALTGYRPVSDAIAAAAPQLPPAVVRIGTLFALAVLTQLIYGAVASRLMSAAWPALRRGRPLANVDRTLGVIPGLASGLVLATIALIPFVILPISTAVSTAVTESALASRLTQVGTAALLQVEDRLGQDLAEGLPSYPLAHPTPDDGVALTLGPVGTLEPDPVAEAQMLDLVNAERAQNGLSPLVADLAIREVARSHSREMFELSYFSHTSPQKGSPFDRLRQGGIRFLLAGENLAYAPTVQIAHRGLMDSPGHRANILRPQFGRVGIGVIRSQFQGSMFTQNFRD